MNLFNLLIFGENILCIYRNLAFMSKYTKMIVITHVTVELCLSLAISVVQIFLTKYLSETDSMVILKGYQVLFLIKNIVLIIGGIGTYKMYKTFNEKVNKIHNLYKVERLYVKSVKVLKIKCLVGAVVFIILFVLLTKGRIYYLYSAEETPDLLEIIIVVLYELWIDIRYMLEHTVLYSSITCIYIYLKCLNNSVQEVLKKVMEDEDGQKPLNEESFQLSEEVDVWTGVYRNILDCGKLISSSFNALMLLSMIAIVQATVSSVYSLISTMVMRGASLDDKVRHLIYVFVFHMAATIPLLLPGQRLQNEYLSLKMTLAKLSNKMSTCKDKNVTRSLKDLIRIVTTNPTVIKFGTFTLGMYLLPIMLSLTATYIVVLLQFNHII